MSLNKTFSGDIVNAGGGTVMTIQNDAVSNAKLADMVPGRVKGVAIDGSTGNPVDLTGAEVGSLHRRYWYIIDSTASGSIAGYVLAEKEIQIHFTSTSASTIHSFTVGSNGKILEIVLESSAAAVTLVNESGSGTLGKIRTPGAVDLVLTAGDGCTLTHINNRYRVTGISRRGVTDRDYGDITVTSNGLTWTVDNGVITPDKFAVVASNQAGLVAVRIAFTASGASGTLIDITIWSSAAPFNLRILDTILLVSTAGPMAGTAELRDTAGGGGSNLFGTSVFQVNTVGRKELDQVASATVSASGSLFLRIDQSAAGELILYYVKT